MDHPALEVPGADRKNTPIEQLSVNESRKTLGLFTNPAGNNSKQLDVLMDLVQKWTKRLCSSRLPVTWAWVSYRRQMWPKMDYGLGTKSFPV